MKEKFKMLLEVIKYPPFLLLFLDYRRIITLSDEYYIKLQYKRSTGKKLDLNNPKTYNEKLQWLKLYDRNPKYTQLVDKYEMKKYVANLIGEEFLIPTLGIYENFDEINFKKLPNQFVIKTTHDSGGVVICKYKKKFDIEKAKEKINNSLKKNYYYGLREWPYKDVKPRIIIEEYLEDKKYGELRDYKFFCFDGEPKYMFIASERQDPTTETKFDFYDMSFKHLPLVNGHPNSSKVIDCPKNFNEMKKLCTKLSKDIPHIRVDFYEINDKVYVGELTLYHWSGLVAFEPEKYDRILGDCIKLPKK